MTSAIQPELDPFGPPVQGPPWELKLPCEPLGPLPEPTVAALRQEAFRINDRYLLDFIEGYSFCPFARGGRRRGQVTRYFHYAETDDITPILRLMAEVAADPQQVVAQVVMPLLEVDARSWDRFVHELTDLGNRWIGGRPTLACAALHPELTFNQKSPNALVPLFRRAPDPTIQWARLDALEALYEGRNHRTTFVALVDIPAFIASPPPLPLYDRIAKSNASMANRLGIDCVVEMLADMRRDAQRSYSDVLLSMLEQE